MFGNELVQNMGLAMLAPQDLNGAATGSCWIDMKDYGHCTFVFMAGESATAAAITFKEAKDTSGTGSQALAFTKYWSTGQKLNIGTVSGAFTVGETITGGTSGLTAYVHTISSDHLLVIPLTGGTTWTTGETLTGGTSAATAVLSGTGQDEDILLDRTASSTFTYPAVTFKMYAVEIDAADLDVEDGYHCIQANIANPGGASIGGGIFILSQPRYRGIPMPSVLGTQKMVADHA
jgi:hypothetical protein